MINFIMNIFDIDIIREYIGFFWEYIGFFWEKTCLCLQVRGGGEVPLCFCLLTEGREGGQNGEKVAYVICECSLTHIAVY